MFGIIRILVGGMILLVCHRMLVLFGKHRERMWRVVSFTVATILTMVSFYVPIENAFVTFDSAEAAWQYVNWGNIDNSLVVEGSDTTLVIGVNDSKHTYLIVPKTENGWAVGLGTDTRVVEERFVDGIIIKIYQYKSSNNYYISIFNTIGGHSEISDNLNSEFSSLCMLNVSLDTSFYTYVAFIPEFTPQYSIMVNGSEVPFSS